MVNLSATQLAATRSRPRAAGWLSAVLLGVGLSLASMQPAVAAPPVREAQMKAAFLYNFTKFVEWPADSYSGNALVIGLFGDSLLWEDLQVIVKDRRVNGRSIVIRRVVTPSEARAVHLLFVDAAEEDRFAEMWPKLAGSSVLVVGESPQFIASGGCIRLILDEQRLRFEINASAAERAQLRISAQLQSLAVAVHRDR